MNNSFTAERYKRTRGFSLVELMVAIVLSSFLLFGVTEIYLSNKQTNTLQNGFAQVQENGRMTVEFLTRDIRSADFWGCIPAATAITNNLDTTSVNYDTSVHDFGSGGLSGFNNASGSGTWGKAVVAGTDVIILRGSSDVGAKVEPPFMPTVAAALHVNKGSKIKAGSVLLVSDCQQGNIFQNTASDTATSGNVTHNTGTGSIGNKTKDFKKRYEANARILAPYVKAYFIANGVNGEPSLHVNLDGVVSELIPGVEDMQITYGEDTDGDLVADTWSTANAVADMEAVVGVKVALTVRSDNPVGSTAAASPDGRLRRSYSVTTNIRNRMI